MEQVKEWFKKTLTGLSFITSIIATNLQSALAQQQIPTGLREPNSAINAFNGFQLRGEPRPKEYDRYVLKGLGISAIVGTSIIGGEEVVVAKLFNVSTKVLKAKGFVKLADLTDEVIAEGPKVYEIVDVSNKAWYGGKTIRIWTKRFEELKKKFKFSDNIWVRIRHFNTEKEALDFERSLIKVYTDDLARGYSDLGKVVETPLNYQHNLHKEKFANDIWKILTDEAKKNSAWEKYLNPNK